MLKAIWVLVNCNSIKEAKLIGTTILKKRLISCFDIIPRHLAAYFWPPKSEKIETSKGATLILETFKRKYESIEKEVKKLHSDSLPFIGYLEIKGLNSDYVKWMKGEIK
jgi:periplasmic divalent cation tolerance protein